MARVDFDFSGSLELARELWQLAVALPSMERHRSGASAAAADDWLGPHGDEFRRRAGNETEAFSQAEKRLRSAANSWAEAWARATDEQNRRDHADAVAAEHASRGAGEKFFDLFVGDDSAHVVGLSPAPVAIPVGPGFVPTG